MLLNQKGVDKALTAVNEQLAEMKTSMIELVVCGGSALQALGLINRTTKDLDILAQATRDNNGLMELNSARELPEVLMMAANLVAIDLDLPSNWLNSGPTDLLTQGLPAGFIDRLHTKKYGTHLIVHFTDRYDQICFKMYAAINGGGERHLNDLYQLNPANEELLFAARWCLTQDASEVFPLLVIDFLQKVGYEDVAARI